VWVLEVVVALGRSVSTTSGVLTGLSDFRGFVLRFLGWARGYVRENWGAPFVLAFMGLLMVAAALLILGLSWSAEAVGNVAYFFLVAGVVLQLLCFRRRGEKDVGGEDA
jgi:hypothetical protein